ncbi:MAG: AtpZ/AtpI family protein [Pseudomonadota bacterium]
MTGDDKTGRSDLDALGEKLAKARGEEPRAAEQAPDQSGAALGDGLKVSIEFFVSVLVGSGLGYTIGGFFGAPVVGLLIGMPIGFAAGLRTIYRGLVQNQDAPEEKDVPDGND